MTADLNPADDTDPQVARQFRREPLLMLLSRMQRGVLLDAERPLLRAAVETELADGDDAHRRAEAMTHAMEDTATDALKHRGCHRSLMAQCQRAERAEAKLAAVRALAEPALSYDDVPQDHLARRILATLNGSAEPSEIGAAL